MTRRNETLSGHDTENLIWYWSLGQSYFERSTSGGMLERADNFQVHALPVPFPHIIDGAIQYSAREVTARPTAEQRADAGYMPELHIIERAAEVSTRLLRLARAGRESALHLHTVYGDTGSAWEASREQPDYPGRLFALWPYTEAGSKLRGLARTDALERAVSAATKAGKGLDADKAAKAVTSARRAALARFEEQRVIDVLWQEYCAQKTRPTDRRGELIESARLTAEGIHRAAVVAWNAVGVERAA